MRIVTGDRLRDGLLILAAVVVLAAAYFGWSWWEAAHDEELADGRERGSVLATGTSALRTLNTIDYRDAAADVGSWIDVTTGQLAQDLAGDKEMQAGRAKSAKTVATAVNRAAAVTELDSKAGTARMIVVLDVKIATNDQAPTDRRSRIIAGLTRTDNGWKVNTVQAAGKNE